MTDYSCQAEADYWQEPPPEPTPQPTTVVKSNKERAIMPDTFRKEYKPLSPDAKASVEAVKEAAEKIEGLLNGVLDPNERSERARCIAVAKTNLEQAIMWAVKGLTA